jgi:hypothetical protein
VRREGGQAATTAARDFRHWWSAERADETVGEAVGTSITVAVSLVRDDVASETVRGRGGNGR